MAAGYNLDAKYEIIGRIQSGTSVIAYMVRDMVEDSASIIEKSIVEQLALNKQIYNCNAQLYGNIVNMKGVNCKLNQLPKYNQKGNLISEDKKPKNKVQADLKLIGKVQTGRIITDYIVVAITDMSKKMKVPKETVIELAQEGRIVNARVQMNNGEMMLRGSYGVNLSQLALYR